MNKDPLGLPPVLAAPQHARRRRITVAVAAHLAVILGTAGVIALIHARSAAGRSSINMVATLTNPAACGSPLVAFSPDGATLAIGDESESVYLWSIRATRLIATLTPPNPGNYGTVPSIAFSPGGHMLAAAIPSSDAVTCPSSTTTYLWHFGAKA